MNLSMWILADRLEKYDPQLHITTGDLVIRGARLFSGTGTLDRNYVYVGDAEYFINGVSKKVICSNGKDYFILNSEDSEHIFNVILDIFESFHAWSEHLHELTLRKCTVQDILQSSALWLEDFTIAGDLGFSITASCNDDLLRANDSYYEYYKHFVELKQVSLKDALQVSDDKRAFFRTQKSYIQDIPGFRNRSIIRNLFHNDKQIGWLVSLELKKTITKGRIQIVNIVGDILELHQSLPDSEREILSFQDIFQNILEGKEPVSSALETKLKMIHWEPEDSKLLMRISKSTTENTQLLIRLLNERLPNAIIFSMEDNLIALINLNWIPDQAIFTEVSGLLTTFGTYGGLSFSFTNIAQVCNAYVQAKIALLHGDFTKGTIASCESCAVSYLMEAIKQNTAADMLHPALAILEKYDSENGTDLKHTLQIYLENERSLVLTGAALNLHKNTVSYRIGRICELTQINLDDVQTRFYLLLSYRLGQVL